MHLELHLQGTTIAQVRVGVRGMLGAAIGEEGQDVKGKSTLDAGEEGQDVGGMTTIDGDAGQDQRNDVENYIKPINER